MNQHLFNLLAVLFCGATFGWLWSLRGVVAALQRQADQLRREQKVAAQLNADLYRRVAFLEQAGLSSAREQGGKEVKA